MPLTETVIPFFIASVLLALAPGPDNMFVLAQSAMYGRRAGLLIVFGLCTGLVLHTVAVVLGLAALLHASPSAFTVFKLVGAGYLLYLPWGAFRAVGDSAAATRPPVLSDGRLYRRGIFMNSTNPKVSLFFLAFLPQFADPARGGGLAPVAGSGRAVHSGHHFRVRPDRPDCRIIRQLVE